MQYETVDLSSNQDLIHSFPATISFIYDQVQQRFQSTGILGKVLVFCESGNERAAGVVAAYLMERHKDVDYIKAMQLVQAQRFCVNFDDAMKRLLQGYWDILCAKRAVAAHSEAFLPPTATTTMMAPVPKVKRGLQTDQGQDGAMFDMNDDDIARFGGRTFTPFIDQELA